MSVLSTISNLFPAVIQKKYYFIILAFLAVVVIQSCRDHDEVLPVNQLKYGDKKIMIETAYYTTETTIVEGADGGDIYVHEIWFLPEGYNYNGKALWATAETLGLALYSKSNSEITLGTYKASYSDERIVDEFASGAMILQGMQISATGDRYVDIIREASKGSIDITKQDDIYTVKFNLTVQSKKITGTYRGTFKPLLF